MTSPVCVSGCVCAELDLFDLFPAEADHSVEVVGSFGAVNRGLHTGLLCEVSAGPSIFIDRLLFDESVDVGFAVEDYVVDVVASVLCHVFVLLICGCLLGGRWRCPFSIQPLEVAVAELYAPATGLLFPVPYDSIIYQCTLIVNRELIFFCCARKSMYHICNVPNDLE